MLNRIASCIVFGVLLLGFAKSSHAQDTQRDLSYWPEQAASKGTLPVYVVLVSQPGVRHRCRAHEVTPTQIVCGLGIGRKPVAYSREDVAAIIDPPNHSARNAEILVLATGAACLAGSFFVPITAVAVLLRVFAGLSLPVDGAMGFGDNEDHDHDILRYQQPGTDLTVALR